MTERLPIEHRPDIVEDHQPKRGRPKGSGRYPISLMHRVGDRFFVRYKRKKWAVESCCRWNKNRAPVKFGWKEDINEGFRGIWIQRIR